MEFGRINEIIQNFYKIIKVVVGNIIMFSGVRMICI